MVIKNEYVMRKAIFRNLGKPIAYIRHYALKCPAKKSRETFYYLLMELILKN